VHLRINRPLGHLDQVEEVPLSPIVEIRIWSE